MALKNLFLLELLEDSLILDASVFGYQIDDGIEDAGPSLVLNLGIRDAGNRIAVLVGEGYLGDDLPTSAIFFIGEARMVHVEIRLVLCHQMIAIVEI